MAKHSALALARLIHKFSPEETERTRAFINCFNTKYGKKDLKSVRLFDLLADRSVTPEDEAIKKEVCPEFTDDAYRKLLARLRLKIYESITLDININSEPMFAEVFQLSIKLQKKRILCQVLALRGHFDEAEDIMNEGINISKRNFLYSDLAYFSIRKNALSGRKTSLRESAVLEETIEKALLLRNVTDYAEFCFSSLVNMERRGTNLTDETLQIEKKIESIEKMPLLQESPPAVYYLQFVKLLLKKKKNEYDDFEIGAYDLLNLLENYPVLKTKTRMANILSLILDACVSNYKFEEALMVWEKADLYHRKGSLNHFDSLRIRCKLLFYLGNLHEVANQLAKIAQNYPEKEDPFFMNQVIYDQSYNLFAQKKYVLASRMLLNVRTLETDKNGWNFNIRLLQVMIRLERADHDEATAIIEGIKRKKNDIRPREYMILKILMSLVTSNFNYRTIIKTEQSILTKLEGTEPDYKWVFFSYEMIPFNRWLKAMANGKSWKVRELVRK